MDYLRCIECGHELLRENRRQQFIINDILSYKEIRRTGLIDRFRARLLKYCSVKHDFLVDIGSASGKFLFYNKKNFKDYVGIEVTDECINFSKNTLGLKIGKDISIINNKIISIVTFWHSLEHMPYDMIVKTLSTINCNSDLDTRLIVSIPNNNSLQYLLFKEKYAYYDPFSHLHQFSTKSIDLLMEKHMFEKQYSFFSLPYALVGNLQSLLNIVNKIHNYFYGRKKRGLTFRKGKYELAIFDLYNLIFISLFLIPSLVLSIYDLINKERGSVINLCYKKRTG